MMANQAFDACEMSLSHYFRHRPGGDFPFVAIPVFPLRKFRHSFIVINTDSGVRVPQDLTGRRVGVMEYSQTAAVWIRGMLQDEYGVDAGKHPLVYGRRQPAGPSEGPAAETGCRRCRSSTSASSAR